MCASALPYMLLLGQSHRSPATHPAWAGAQVSPEQENPINGTAPPGSKATYGTQSKVLHKHHFMLSHSNTIK